MNTAVEPVVTQRAAASNKIFNRVRQNWMRGFVNELNGRETEGECELLEVFTARDLQSDSQTTGRIIQQLKACCFSIQTRQPCLRVGQAQPAAATRFEHSLGVDPGTVVFDLNTHDAIPRR